MLNSILYLVGNKNKLKITFIFFIVGIVFVFEFLSLVSIPIYTTALLNSEPIIQKVEPFINDKIKEHFLIYSSIFVATAFLLKNFFLLLSRYVTEKFLTNLRIKLSTSIFNHYFDSKYLDAQKLKPSEMYRDAIPAVTGTYAYIQNALGMFTEFGAIIIIFCILVTLNAKLTLSLIFIFSIITLLYIKFIKGTLKRRANENQKLSSVFNKSVSETFEALKDIKIYQKEEGVKDKFLSDITKFEKNIFFFKVFDTFPKIILELTSIIIILGISLLISIQSDNPNEFIELLPFLVLVIISCIRLIPAFNAINLSLFYTRVYQASVDNVINQLRTIDEKKLKTIVKKDIKKIFKLNLDIKKNYIVAENITFSYPEKSNLIKNLSLNISKNTLNAIIGPTGSGKSTLQHILMGLIQPNKGNIFFENQNINTIYDKWLSKIGYVSQKIFLLDDSMQKNICLNLYEDEIDEARLKKAITVSELDKVFGEKKLSITDQVGTDGLLLSGGEKQRIALARALYKNSEILFLDEFTSNLDYKTQENILNNLRNYFPEITILMISHRPEITKLSDTIIDLKEHNLKIN